MAKFGIIYTAYNTEQYVSPSLATWMAARESKLGGNEFFVCAVCTPFKNFEASKADSTSKILEGFMGTGHIDTLIQSDEPMDETEARGMALKSLMDKGVDYVWQVDSDEFYTKENIENIVKFVNKSLVAWFRISYKNYVFDTNTFMTEPFTPARIHRVIYNDFSACGFWDDNNIEYVGAAAKYKQLDNSMPNLTIPKNIAWVMHLTWLNDERSRKKVEYQKARNWVCSFRWDNEFGLMWNDDYFTSKGIPTPEIEVDRLPNMEAKNLELEAKNA